MDGKNPPKTKAELLRELQSIQALLDEQNDEVAEFDLDDDDIPILDEFLADDAGGDDADTQPLHTDDESLEADTLDALNAAYAALTREPLPKDIEQNSEHWLDELEALAGDDDEALEDDYEKASQQPPERKASSTATNTGSDASAHSAQDHPQTAASSADAQQRADEPAHRQQSDPRHRQSPERTDPGLTSTHTDPAAPAPLPGQQSLFDSPRADKPNRPERPPQPTRARGENPFLPQHIRERLRGNQVLPKGDFLQPSTRPAHHDLPAMPEGRPAQIAEPEHKAAETTPDSPESPPPALDLEELIDDLVAAALPELEQKLRAALKATLKKDPTPPH